MPARDDKRLGTCQLCQYSACLEVQEVYSLVILLRIILEDKPMKLVQDARGIIPADGLKYGERTARQLFCGIQEFDGVIKMGG